MTVIEILHSEHLARRQRLWNYKPTPINTEPTPADPVNNVESDSKSEQPIVSESNIELRFPTIREIQHVVCDHFKVSYADIISSRRDQAAVMARQCAMYLSRHLTPNSLPKIALRFGGKDHTTVIHAVRKIGAVAEFDRELASMLENFKAEILDLVARNSLEAK